MSKAPNVPWPTTPARRQCSLTKAWMDSYQDTKVLLGDGRLVTVRLDLQPAPVSEGTPNGLTVNDAWIVSVERPSRPPLSSLALSET